MMLVSTYVAPSPIEGVGIFAAVNIPAGSEIWRFSAAFDRTFTADELEELDEVQREYVARYGYTHMEDRSLTVVETDNGRFMNHSDHPNTDFTRPDVGYAIVDIPAGTEIVCDYGDFEEEFAMLPGRKFVHTESARL
ncbi:MAG: SET domain-containing protein-lysine N-methyltransferase [Pseudomonadota bacterium]